MSDAFAFAAGTGQRSTAFTFERLEGASGRPLGPLHPVRTGQLAASGHASITRSLSLDLGEADAAAVDTDSEQVRLSMTIGGATFPLGTYRYIGVVDQDWAPYTGDEPRSLVTLQLSDMAVLDTQIQTGFDADDEAARSVAERLLDEIGIPHRIEDSPQSVSNSWMAGTSRKQILEAVAELGGYLAPWFDNAGVLRMIRRFDPDAGVPDFDFDASGSVKAESVTRESDSALAPNRIVVVSNSGATATGSGSATDPGPVMAFCDVPSTAPHSIMNIGFVRPAVYERQVDSISQAQEIADLLCLRQTVAERLTCATALDPRHEAHQTVRFEGRRWLETGWSMALEAGGDHQHVLQRSYPPSAEVLSGTAGQVIAEGGT